MSQQGSLLVVDDNENNRDALSRRLVLKGYEVTAWFGLVAPAATPKPVVARLNEALNKTTQDPQVRKLLEGSGATVIQGAPEAFRDFVKNEQVKWAPIVKRANIVPD